MKGLKSISILAALGLLFLGFSECQPKTSGEKEAPPTLDLEDYIDTPKNKEDLSTSATGYYGHGHHGHHQPYHHAHTHTTYHHAPLYHHHGHHGHYPYHFGHAQTYFNGEYGGIGHIGSAHVNFGTDINHGLSHHHHHQHSYHG